MAPKKRGNDEDREPVAKLSSSTATATTRVTRSSTGRARGEDAPAESVAASSLPKAKKAKTGSTSNKAKTEVTAEAVAESESPLAKVLDDNGSKTIVIEHCKQCNSFKTRAIQVKNGLETGVAGITVLVNPLKPRRGCFEIREEGGDTFISLLDMKRPFKAMKDLDMEKVISDIVEKIK